MQKLFFTLALLTTLAGPAHAWGTKGHGAVGVLAVEQSSAQTRNAITALLGSTDQDDVVAACYWSDTYRDMGDGQHMARQHYVNVDPKAKAYSGRRDCADGQCVTAAINRFAARLGDLTLTQQERRLAFKHLCHFMGDLHQPLHVGYADDEGGNKVTIRYHTVEMKLHHYWDSGLIDQKTDSLAELLEILRKRRHQSPGSWSPADTYSWTNESYSLMKNFAYPATRTVDKGFEERSWQVVQQQLDVAAARLAVMLDWILGAPVESVKSSD